MVLNTLQSVQTFMTRNNGVLGNLNTSASRKALDDLEAQLSDHAASQTSAASGTKAAIARQRVLRNTLLVKYLRPVSAIAEAQLNQSPDFIALKLPRAIRSTQQVLAAAESMGTAAATYAVTFIAAGMAPTFVSDLQAAAAEFKAGAALRSHTLSSQIGATSGLRIATQQAHKVVKALDALIEPTIASNPALLSQWKATKRFTGRPTAIAGATVDSSATVSAVEVPSQGTPASAPSGPPAVAVPGSGAAATPGGGTPA
jgi:hypothetical protein